jgi:hypothetical protein
MWYEDGSLDVDLADYVRELNKWHLFIVSKTSKLHATCLDVSRKNPDVFLSKPQVYVNRVHEVLNAIRSAESYFDEVHAVLNRVSSELGVIIENCAKERDSLLPDKPTSVFPPSAGVTYTRYVHREPRSK